MRGQQLHIERLGRMGAVGRYRRPSRRRRRIIIAIAGSVALFGGALIVWSLAG
jgi:hypothetical protein